ncbi:Rieske 2Fe-2S domain-containing protein [Rhizobium bangladeshense]|uniref:Rieske 2Fe-2S domain-containing protein n=1 Tax=Rhizobium bangladeshense TaxID=1138189 RepID=A0ABS7LNS6_9HYPH|nr:MULTISPECIES: Rieske 2Fe-2S domain-containing protein [Rhizobium]MBX4870085.1 Rieske 2Fe-2S domain-containing protein [Rhizobium bangladeshense]MBX4886407.1 Rieske 2Fe-2S domain-containing protein [Rhizobium bangladeshense]MBY3592918.1 Rieske 2Fe-2S domain-containing protein [Rhizobium bangladeshense]TLW97601.1 Rieske 2Fe-2S domain-containing protein [Rhizobium sp. MHM7A]
MPSDTAGSWTPVALSADLPPATVIPAWTPLGAIALWRSQSGCASASSDRCPHRGMRLSHGFVRGEVLSCIYHGWSYSSAGGCVRIPAHPDLVPPDTIRVAVQRVEESDGIVWVAGGEPAMPPPRLDHLVPIRSLTLNADIAAIEAAAGGKADADGLIQVADCPWVRLLPAAQIGCTLIHVLVEQERSVADRVTASRIAEAVRRRAETGQKDVA